MAAQPVGPAASTPMSRASQRRITGLLMASGEEARHVAERGRGLAFRQAEGGIARLPADEPVAGAGLDQDQPAGGGAVGQFGVQLLGVVVVGVWSAALTFGIINVVDAIVPLRVSDGIEIDGLDITTLGERAYTL